MTKLAITPHRNHIFFVAALVTLALLSIVALSLRSASAEAVVHAADEHIITLHDDGVEKGFITKAKTLREAFADAGIRVDARDVTEPSMDEKLVAASYEVNIYRARMVIIRDGGAETKVISAYRTGKQIAKQAGMTLRDEDVVELKPSTDIVNDGAAEVMTVRRATAVNFEFYGKKTVTYTRAETVAEMLRTKGIRLNSSDGILPGLQAKIVKDMSIRLWRNGIQMVTVDEDVAFEVEQRRDANRDRGFKEVVTPGENGRRSVSYEINMQNGVEVSRKEINSTITKQPVKQVEIIGAKVVIGNGLTKSKGVFMFTDSSGVTHRETYYDLPMGAVMRNCGMGGYYTVREDGVKVDRDGYVIIAANLANYPRCSVVETSVGAAKVYDTGGFAAYHPHGYDIATDWTNYDGI